MSESSQDFEKVIQSLLTSKHEWQQVPQIAYFTIKALYGYLEVIEERGLRNKEIITEQSIKIRQIDLKLENITNEVYYERELLAGLDSLPPADTGFKKNKKQTLNKSKSKEKQRSVKKQELSQNKSLTYGNESQLFPKESLDNRERIGFEEIRDAAEFMIEEKIKKMEERLADDYRRVLKQKMSENETELEKWTRKIEEQLRELQLTSTRKVIDLETKLSINMLKNQNQLMAVFEENFVSKEHLKSDLGSQIQDIRKQIDEKFAKASNLAVKNEKKGNKKKTEASKVGCSEPNQNYLAAQNRKTESNESLSKQIYDLKFQIMREITAYAKMSDVENIINKFHEDVIKKISKISKGIEDLEREVYHRELVSQVSCQSFRPTVVKNRPKEQKQESPQNTQRSTLNSIQQSLKTIQKSFKEKLSELKRQTKREIQNFEEKITEDFEKREKYFCQVVEENCKKMPHNSLGNDTGLRKMIVKLSEQMVMARYLHYGEKECKQFISWEKQAFNAMEENFLWKNGQTVITIVESGLYKVEAGLYNITNFEKTEAFLVVNGENVGVLHLNELPRNSQTKSKGMILSEPLLISAKSKLSIRVETTFYGQAYIQIQKL